MRRLHLLAAAAALTLAHASPAICGVDDGAPEGSGAGGGKSAKAKAAPAAEVAAEPVVEVAELTKVRVLWVPPSEKNIVPGKVYALADGAHRIAAGEAEAVADDVEAEADPRPQPEAAQAADEA